MAKQIDILREYMIEEHYIKDEALLKQIKDKGYIGDQHEMDGFPVLVSDNG
jgi:hypothetical protein